jgi:O-antigen/teichoic acid export membrane protein
LTLHVKKKYLKAGILFGLPIILHTLGKFVTNQSDRIFIAKMVSIKEAGIYNIGYQVGMVILIFVNAVTSFIQPFLFERLSNLTEKAKIEIVRVSYLIILGMLALLLLLTFVTPFFFYYLIDKSYLGGRIFVFWTGLGYFFWAIYVVFAGYIFYLKKTKILGYLSILNISLNLVLNYFLILKFGPIGASYATCISYFVIASIITIVATSFYSLPWLKARLIFSR